MLNIDLDEEAKQYLDEILEKKPVDVSELIKQLLREHADALLHRKAAAQTTGTLSERKTIIERMGGMPEYFFEGHENLSDRDVRKKVIAERIRQNHERSHRNLRTSPTL